MTFKFDDHCMRNDWFHMIELSCKDKNFAHMDHRLVICEAMDERRSVVQRGVLALSFDLEKLTQVVEVRPDTPELLSEVIAALEH